MQSPRSADERLVAALLQRMENTTSATDIEHLPIETLAQFAEGSLPESEQAQTEAHLALCAECRQTVSLVMVAEEQASTPIPAKWRLIVSRPWLAFALAASLLLTLGIWFHFQGANDAAVLLARADARLRAGDFRAVEQLTEDTWQHGTAAPELLNLRAQAARKIPDALALNHAGRLTDFGVELGGIAARNSSQTTGLNDAERALNAADKQYSSREVMLNRGHLELSRNQFAAARAAFDQVLATQPHDVDALLGQGLTQYLTGDYHAAEATFAQAEGLAPQRIAVAWNRAMTLEELDRTTESVKIWRDLLPRLPVAERQAIERHLQELQSR